MNWPLEWKRAAKWYRKRHLEVTGKWGLDIPGLIEKMLHPHDIKSIDLERIRWKRKYDDLCVLVCGDCRHYYVNGHAQPNKQMEVNVGCACKMMSSNLVHTKAVCYMPEEKPKLCWCGRPAHQVQ